VRKESAASFDLAHEEFQRVGQRVLDSIWEAIWREQQDPILPSVRGHNIRDLLDEPLPCEGIAVDAVIEVWTDTLLPLCRYNRRPRFFGYVVTSSDPVGSFADPMASALNQGLTAWCSALTATEVERVVLL